MGFFDFISTAVSAVVGVIKKVADVVMVAIAGPSIETIATAGLTVAAVGGIGFLAYKLGKRISNFFKERRCNHSEPSNILEKSLKAAADRCGCSSEYALEGGNHRTIKEVLADTFSNRKHIAENKDVEYDDTAFNEKIDAAMEECAEIEIDDIDVDDVYESVVRTKKTGKRNVKSKYNGRYSKNCRYPLMPSTREDINFNNTFDKLQREARA